MSSAKAPARAPNASGESCGTALVAALDESLLGLRPRPAGFLTAVA